MQLELDRLFPDALPDDLTGLSLAELRQLRDELQDVENGISYARRLVQGRIDTVTMELERRNGSDDEALIERLSDALAGHGRGSGLPRPLPSLEPPAWADELVADVDRGLPVVIDDSTPEVALQSAIEELGSAESALSGARHDLHRSIDRVQDELVSRYRDGAPVDDLLS